MNAGGRVVLIEMRLGDFGEPGLGPLVDVNMMAVTGAASARETNIKSSWRRQTSSSIRSR